MEKECEIKLVVCPDSDEFNQADIDTIYSGMRGYEPYQDGKQVTNTPDKFREYAQKVAQ